VGAVWGVVGGAGVGGGWWGWGGLGGGVGLHKAPLKRPLAEWEAHNPCGRRVPREWARTRSIARAHFARDSRSAGPCTTRLRCAITADIPDKARKCSLDPHEDRANDVGTLIRWAARRGAWWEPPCRLETRDRHRRTCC